jgi:DNA primase
MLLAAGLNIKVLSLPDGDDPDSYAQNHTATELEDYLATHEVDFIRFKTNILLQDSGDDPIKRSQVINDLLRSVSVIENEVVRTVYIAECSRMLQVPETVLARQVAALIAKRREDDSKAIQRRHAENSISDLTTNENLTATESQQPAVVISTVTQEQQSVGSKSNQLEPYEREIVRYVLKYGMLPFCDAVDENNQTVSISLLDYINDELSQDEIKLTVPIYVATMDYVTKLAHEQWPNEYAAKVEECEQLRQQMLKDGEEKIRREARDMADITNRESVLITDCNETYNKTLEEFSADYIRRILTSVNNDQLRRLATDLTTERHHLSKVHTKYTQIESERDRLIELVPRAIYELKDAVVGKMLNTLNERLKTLSPTDTDTTMKIIKDMQDYQSLRNELAKYLGDRIIIPRRR